MDWKSLGGANNYLLGWTWWKSWTSWPCKDQEASQALLVLQERMALMDLLEKEAHLVRLEVLVCLD